MNWNYLHTNKLVRSTRQKNPRGVDCNTKLCPNFDLVEELFSDGLPEMKLGDIY